MVRNYRGKIELKPERFAYVQCPDFALCAKSLILDIERRWHPPGVFYHFRRKGGHVAAINQHLESVYFAKLDFSNFFGQITKSKIINALKKINYSYLAALDIAVESTVYCQSVDKFHLPYGFRQSPIIASLVMSQSNFYRQVKETRRAGLIVTIYVDDVLISGTDKFLVNEHFQLLVEAANASNFSINCAKSHAAKTELSAFNINLVENELRIESVRQQQFEEDLLMADNLNSIDGIMRYVETVNAEQAQLLDDLSKSHLARINN